MNLACNCQFETKNLPSVYGLIGLTLMSICLPLCPPLSHAIPCKTKFTIHEMYSMSPSGDLIPFISSQGCWTGMQTEGLYMLLSIYKAECMALQQHQLLVYSSSPVGWEE